MRLRKYIAFAGMAVLMLCSCNEMENAPTNKFTDNSYWTSTTKAQYVVNMAYSQMYNAGRMWSDESLSDNAYDGRSVDDQRAIRKGMATPSLDIFKNEWKDLYGGIKTCHVFLEKVDLVPNMDASVKARMIAEIRYIRASLYFRLTNLYGAVPFFTEDITLEESRSVSRTDRETIISFIHQELEDIKDALPTRDQLPEEDKGKITKGAVSTTIVGIGSRTRTNVDDYVFTAIVHIATPVIAIINDSSGETWVTVVVRISRVIICPGFTDSLSTKHQISIYQ